jgi:hypothetical protein
MEALRQQLSTADIACDDMAVLTRTDRGDVLTFTADGGEAAIGLWRHMRDMVAATHHWPVLLGSEEEVANHREMAEINPAPVADTLAYAETIGVPQWFDRQKQERLDEFREYNEGEDPADFLAPVGDWPAGARPNNAFLTPFDIVSRKAHKRVAFALVPTVTPWEVPAFLRLGGWNACPEPAVHCAVYRYWQQEYGAAIVAATHDVIEMHVERPPRTREAAMALAEQQYIYCADIVEQGTQTLAALAAGLLNGSAWFFWWD